MERESKRERGSYDARSLKRKTPNAKTRLRPRQMLHQSSTVKRDNGDIRNSVFAMGSDDDKKGPRMCLKREENVWEGVQLIKKHNSKKTRKIARVANKI